ncbi:MAG: UDP-N-acetylmuramate--alanine ligase [Candidatus Frackibacter sp. T328-2]|nr:MAG: UDP-N-acetylmuramate--alanine ligase [Candidatus Frackibacter sp. T328-2]
MRTEDRVHLIGIGGIGMSGIANLLLGLGKQVTGSDMKESDIIIDLRKEGAEIKIGHKAENVEGADVVVVSSAIPMDNPEIIEAKKQEIPILKRAEMVAKLMTRQKGIAISGTHGKTTTTAMVATILKENGLDPTILVGGKLSLINGNAKLGNGDYFVTEADESDGSLLFMEPEIGVVTNIEADHLDYYESKEEIKETFIQFLNKLPAQGRGIVCLDDKEIVDIVDEMGNDLITYGLTAQAKLFAEQIELNHLGSNSSIYYQGKKLGNLNLRVPGKHNLANALAAISIGLHIGLQFKEIASALKKFRGVGRRFEQKGKYRGAVLVDDYAHHPTEIEATLSAAQNMDFKKVIAIFQPHRYSRTKFLLEEFSQAFTDADEVIITDIYAAGEDPIPGVEAERVANLINQRNFGKAKFISDLDDVYHYLQKKLQAGELLLTLGAGDVWKVGERLAITDRKIQAEETGELTMEV